MKRVLIIAGLMLSGISNAQQIPQYSQYLRNQFMVNPGAAGVYDFVDITMDLEMSQEQHICLLHHRSQRHQSQSITLLFVLRTGLFVIRRSRQGS